MKTYRVMTTCVMGVIMSAALFLAAGTESRAYYYGNDKRMYDTFAEMEKVNRAQTAMENPDLRDVTLQAATIYTLTMSGNGEFGGRISGSEARTIMDIREKGMLVIGGHSNEALQLILSNGYMTEFVDEFKAWGYLDSGYALPEIPALEKRRFLMRLHMLCTERRAEMCARRICFVVSMPKRMRRHLWR